MTPKGMKHLALMEQFLEDARVSETPWDKWECKRSRDTNWSRCLISPSWFSDMEYRRKQETVTMEGITFSKPLTKEEFDSLSDSWVVCFPSFAYYGPTIGSSCKGNLAFLPGLLHKKEVSAKFHAKALELFNKRICTQ